MKCPICKQEKFTTKNTYILKNGNIARTKICDKCKHKIKTIEIIQSEYENYQGIIIGLRKIIKKFVKFRESQT